jgi:hypothetical protein
MENHRITLKDPEKRIRDYFTEDGLHAHITHGDDVFGRSELVITSTESGNASLNRSLTEGDVDGPQLEGMCSPVDKFERSAMLRQDYKKQDIYGTQLRNPMDAVSLSELNL